ncbi:class I adenylate-forming enzyme family protein [Devosia sp.]|uniref:class I adenylate-forming enzyme family protein n=1 Tax=Devosia sp. TaxID=1871048 RepID=UPI003BADA50B
MRFTDLISYQALLEPSKPAIVAGGKIVTFGMLEHAVRSLSGRIHALGLQPGSLVGLSIEVPSRHVALSLALARCGLVSVPYASAATLSQLPPLALGLSDGGLVVGSAAINLVVTDEWFAPSEQPVPDVAIADDADCRVFMSSGTTGTPKPIFQSFGGMDAQAQVVANHHLLAGRVSRILCAMPLKSAWGYRSTIAALANGIAVYFAAGTADIPMTLAAYGCEYLICSVYQLQELVRLQSETMIPLPSLAAVCTGGSLVPAELVRSAQSLLCSRIILIYGSSEVGHSALEVAGMHPWQDGATGFVTPWTEMEAIAEDGRVLPRGETGELRVRSFAQARFGGQPAPDGELPWFYPGDRGSISPDGRLTISGRTVDILNIGGTKLSSERIEHALKRHPMVIDAGVMGVADRQGLTEVRAAVTVRGAVAEAELRSFVATSFPVAAPQMIKIVAAIPRGDTGKILREELRALLN